MRRRFAALIGALLLIPSLGVAPVSAASIQLVADPWIGAGSVGGGLFTDTGATYTGLFENSPLPSEEYRWAVEFLISGLPTGGTITTATLSLRNVGNSVCAGGACLIDLAGYVGNGAASVDDLIAGSNLLTFAPMSSVYENHDVTAFVTSLYVNGDAWAGFGLTRAAASVPNDVLGWDSPEDGSPPLLTIVYALPTPSPAASLANAAMAPPSPGSPLATIGFGLLLIGSLGVLAALSRGPNRR